MGVVGFTIKEIHCEVKKPLINKVEVQHIPQIEEVKSTKIIDAIGNKKTSVPAVKIEYSFVIQYIQNDEEAGVLKIKGDLLYKTDSEKESKDLEKRWKDKKELKGKEVEILNILMRKNIPKFMYLADLLALPPVLKIPRFISKNENKNDESKRSKKE